MEGGNQSGLGILPRETGQNPQTSLVWGCPILFGQPLIHSGD